MFACAILGFATAYLVLYGAGLANARTGNPAALLVLGLPVLPVLLVGLLFRIYRTAAISALITIALFLVMVLGFVGPFLFGEHAQSGDGAGLGLGAGLVFVWQWGIVLLFLVIVPIGLVIERKAFFSREQQRRQSVRIDFQAEQSHAPEPAVARLSSGESSPPAR